MEKFLSKLIVCLMIPFLLVGCNENGNEASIPNEIEVEGSYDIKNLSEGQSVYLIVDKEDLVNFPDCSVANNFSISSVNPTRSLKGRGINNDNIVETQLGNKLVTPHSNPSENTVSGEQLGASSDKVTVKVTHVKADNDLVITYEEIKKIGKTTGGFINSYGDYENLPIEEHYHIPANRLNRLKNLNEVAIFQQSINMGGEKYDYGFIREGKINLLSNSKDIYGLVDLGVTKTGEISLFNCIEADTREGSELRLCMENPVDVTFEDQDILEDDSFSGKSFVYKIKKTSTDPNKHYVLEITKGVGINSDDYEIFNGWGLGDARYIGPNNNGQRRKQMLTPIKNTETTLVFYVGQVEEDFIFNLVINKNNITNYGKIKLREMNQTDCSSFAVLTNSEPTKKNINGNSCSYSEGNNVTLTLTPDNGVIGFIIKNTTNKDLTYEGKYAASEDYKPKIELLERGTDKYYSNGTGKSGITSDFNSNVLLGFPCEGVSKNDTIIVYLKYNDNNTKPVDITLSFGEPFTRE